MYFYSKMSQFDSKYIQSYDLNLHNSVPKTFSFVPDSITINECEAEIERRINELEILSSEIDAKFESLKHSIQKALCVTNVLEQELYKHKDQSSVVLENQYNQQKLREYFEHIHKCAAGFNTFISL